MPRPAKSSAPARKKARSAAAPAREVPVATLPLRELLRRPLRVKQLVAAGHEVRITDNGRPLWLLRADSVHAASDEARVADAWEDTLQDLELEALKGSTPALSVSRLLIAQRHEALR